MRQLPRQIKIVGEVFRSPQLRRLELSWASYHACEWAQFVAISVYAYDRGGAPAVGIFGFVRMLAAAAAAPFGSVLADRYSRKRLQIALHAARAVVLAGVAAALSSGAPTAVVFALAGLASLCGGPFRPAYLALIPSLARTPQELVAANVSSSAFEGAAVLIGPAIAGVLLTVTSPAIVVALSAGISWLAATLVARVGPEEWRPPARLPGWTAVGETLAGFRTLQSEPNPRLIVMLFGAQSFVRGLLNVLIVAVSIRYLGSGRSGVGFLTSALGVGGLAGGLGALSVVHRRRLAGPFTFALALWGAPIAAVAAWPAFGWAALCIAAVGAGNALLDVSGYTLIQRIVDDRVLGRVFGVFEILASGSVGIGSICAPVLLSELSVRESLIVTGSLLPALAILCRPRLRKIDDSVVVREDEFRLLSGVSLFAPLPVATLEKLAARLIPVSAPAGTHIVEQNDVGDLFFLIRSGTVRVLRDGRPIAKQGAGDYFGEIALLRDIPRTATCVAATDVELLVLERSVFVSAVTGHIRTTATADDVMKKRMGDLEPSAP